MNDEQRIQYYLGKTLSSYSSINLDEFPSITMDELKDNKLYDKPLYRHV